MQRLMNEDTQSKTVEILYRKIWYFSIYRAPRRWGHIYQGGRDILAQLRKGVSQGG